MSRTPSITSPSNASSSASGINLPPDPAPVLIHADQPQSLAKKVVILSKTDKGDRISSTPSITSPSNASSNASGNRPGPAAVYLHAQQPQVLAKHSVVISTTDMGGHLSRTPLLPARRKSSSYTSGINFLPSPAAALIHAPQPTYAKEGVVISTTDMGGHLSSTPSVPARRKSSSYTSGINLLPSPAAALIHAPQPTYAKQGVVISTMDMGGHLSRTPLVPARRKSSSHTAGEPTPVLIHAQQPRSFARPGMMLTTTGVMVGRPVGRCPICGMGDMHIEYSYCGLSLAVCFFPIGILCCLCLMERRCSHCGASFGRS